MRLLVGDADDAPGAAGVAKASTTRSINLRRRGSSTRRRRDAAGVRAPRGDAPSGSFAESLPPYTKGSTATTEATATRATAARRARRGSRALDAAPKASWSSRGAASRRGAARDAPTRRLPLRPRRVVLHRARARRARSSRTARLRRRRRGRRGGRVPPLRGVRGRARDVVRRGLPGACPGRGAAPGAARGRTRRPARASRPRPRRRGLPRGRRAGPRRADLRSRRQRLRRD